jgi:hypothetical protein
VLSTAPIARVSIFDVLLACNGSITTSQITKFLNVSEPTAHRTMTEFKALGLVDMKKQPIECDDGITRNGLVITLRKEFDWFIGEEFKILREGFTPASSNGNDDRSKDKLKLSSSSNSNEDEKEESKEPDYDKDEDQLEEEQEEETGESRSNNTAAIQIV